MIMCKLKLTGKKSTETFTRSLKMIVHGLHWLRTYITIYQVSQNPKLWTVQRVITSQQALSLQSSLFIQNFCWLKWVIIFLRRSGEHIQINLVEWNSRESTAGASRSLQLLSSGAIPLTAWSLMRQSASEPK